MPDIVYKFVGDDQVTPVINKLKSELSSGGGRGGGGGGEGGVSFLQKQMEEFTAGLGYQIGLWNVGFALASKATDALGEAISGVITDVQSYHQWITLVGQSNITAASSFQQVGLAAATAGTTIEEISKKAAGPAMFGVSPEDAIASAAAQSRILKQTGQDLGDAGEKAKYYGATIQDALKMGAVEAGRGRPELQQTALEAYRFENTRKFVEFEKQLRQQAESDHLEDRQRADREGFEDTWHNINREREERHRSANYALQDQDHAQEVTQRLTERQLSREMEDRHKIQRRQMEDSDYQINRETELRHQAANWEMEDRHRIAERAQQDRAVERQERAEAFGGFAGAAEAVGTGTYQMQFRDPRTGKMQKMGVPPELASYYEKQFAAGAQEMSRVTGLSPEAIKTYMAQGALQPGAVLGMAQAAQERKDREADRAREDESRKQQREQTLENQKRAYEQYVRNRNLSRSQADESQAQQRGFQDLQEQAQEDRYNRDRDQSRAQTREDVDARDKQYQGEKTLSRGAAQESRNMQRDHRRENQAITAQSLGYQKDLNQQMGQTWDEEVARQKEGMARAAPIYQAAAQAAGVAIGGAPNSVEDKIVASLLSRLVSVFVQ